MGLVSDRVYLAATSLLRFCSRASRTYCSIRHLDNCDSVIGNVKGVVEISEHDVLSTCRKCRRSSWRGSVPMISASLSSLAAPPFLSVNVAVHWMYECLKVECII
jgi:hypothetical protein